MYYLECKNCKNLNEVKSEYLIFCSKCDKKLENNYRDWKKSNYDNTLDNFKETMCVTENNIVDTSSKKKAIPKSLKYWIGFTLSFAVFYAIAHFGGEEIVQFFSSEKTAKEVLEQEWIKETYGAFGLTVETPVEMTKGDLPIPDEVRQIIEQMDVYNYSSSKGFKVLINSIKYNPVVGESNLQGAANGAVNEVKMINGVTNFSYSEDYIYKNNIPGYIQKGSYRHDGIGVGFINTGFAKGLILWQVYVAFQTDDEVGRIAAERVIESIELDIDTNNG